MTVTVNVQDAKTRLSELLKLAEAGEQVVIARAGRPIAELRPVAAAEVSFGGFDVEVGEDFFEELPADELAAWEAL